MREVDIQEFNADLEEMKKNPTMGERQAKKAEKASTDILVKEVNDFRHFLVSIRKYLITKGPSLEIYVSMLAYEQRMGLLFELTETGYLRTYRPVRKGLIQGLSILGYLIPLLQRALAMPSKADAVRLIRRFFKKEIVIDPDFVWSKEEQDFIPSVVEVKGKVRKVAIEPRYLKGKLYITKEGKVGTQERPFYESEEEVMDLLDTLKVWSEGLKPIPQKETWGKK